jgi:hypothetical protein
MRRNRQPTYEECVNDREFPGTGRAVGLADATGRLAGRLALPRLTYALIDARAPTRISIRRMDIFQLQSARSLDEISHVIQLAIAPVFLLTAVGTLLMVLTNRLGRAVDRRRALEARVKAGASGSDIEGAASELGIIARRVAWIYRAIVLAVFCALFVCLLIALAFVDAFIAGNFAKGLGVLFVLAMVALIGSLLTFLREIFLAVSYTSGP